MQSENPQITELFACTRKMLVIMFFSLRNMLNNKTIEINNFTSVTK